MPYPAGEIAGIDKKAFFALSLVRSLENFKQGDEDNVTLILFVHVHCMRSACLYITYSVRILFLRSSLQGISRHLNQMRRTSLTLSLCMYVSLGSGTWRAGKRGTMEKLEVVKRYVREDKLEEAIRLLNQLDDNSTACEQLKKQCRKDLSDQYIYLIKECIAQRRVKEGLSIVDKYRDIFGDSNHLMNYQKALIDMQMPMEKIQYRLLHTKSYKPAFIFFLFGIIGCYLMFYLYDVFDLGCGTGQSVGVYALVLICISVACISLFISMKSIHNSMQITYDKEYKVRYLVIVCVVSLFVSQIFALYIFFMGYYGIGIDYIGVIMMLVMSFHLLSFIAYLYMQLIYGKPEYKPIIAVGLCLQLLPILPMIGNFSLETMLYDMGVLIPFTWVMFIPLLSSGARLEVYNKMIDSKI